MKINLKCGKCKENIETIPFAYLHTIIIKTNPITMKKYYEANVHVKTVCHNCGDIICAIIGKDISNKDIERICYGEEEKHN